MSSDRDWLALDRVRQDNGTFLSYAEQCERKHGSRARSVLAYIDLALDAPPQRLPGNKGRSPKGHSRRQHPAKMASAARRTQAVPDPVERDVQRVKHRISQVVREGSGWLETLRVIAEEVAPQLQLEHDLKGEEHRAAIVDYLTGVWGLTAKQFPLRPGIPGYLEWREASRWLAGPPDA